MDGGFACPECGCEISPAGLSPGRRVRCGWCRTWVEVPYLPRAEQVKTLRRHRDPAWRRRWPLWAKGLVAVLAVAIALAVARRVVKSHRQKAGCEAVARLVESSREAETSGRLGEALAAIEGAVAVAADLKPTPADLDDLRTRRDRLARREAEAQLAALAAGTADDPGRSVGRALTLLARVRKDGSLDGLEPAVGETLERLRTRWAEADAAAAGSAFSAGRPAEAMEFCRRLDRTAGELPREPCLLWQARATDLGRRIVGQHGVTILAARGQFTLGTQTAYSRLIDPPLKDALRAAGYLPKPPGALRDDFWTAEAPYRVTFEAKERQTETYLSSAIELTVTLWRRDRRVWHASPVGRTQVPLPGLPAYQASRFSLSPHRSPEFERLLYENAREALIQQIQSSFRLIPPCPSDTTERPATVAGGPPL